MRVALVKQMYDVFGPWSGVLWKDTDPYQILNVWPGKAVYWELTCLLQADWYIVPPQLENDYVRDAVRKHEGRADLIARNVKNVAPENQIPFSAYDLIITFDPILVPPENSRTLFAYFVQEHWDSTYARSLAKPLPGYDLFLAHMMDGPSKLTKLPQTLSFPYVHDPCLVRRLFGRPKKEIVWVDWRVAMTLANRGLGDPWSREADAALERLRAILDMEVRCRTSSHAVSYAISATPAWGDPAEYYRELAECRYYVAVGQLAGAGQGLADAASAGSICIGQADRAYHRMLCHPSCLCSDIAEMPRRLRAAVRSPELQQEILRFQDQALVQQFKQEPIGLLEAARQIKGRVLPQVSGSPGTA